MYLQNDRVELISTTDKGTKLKKGDKGTVRIVDSLGTVHVDWDNGSTLGMVSGEDRIKLIWDTEEQVEKIKASSNPKKEFFNQMNKILGSK
jgi:hypothetical protein